MAKRCTMTFKRSVPAQLLPWPVYRTAARQPQLGGEAESVSRPRGLILRRRQSRIPTADAQGEMTTTADAKGEKTREKKQKRCEKTVFPASDDERLATRVGKARGTKQAWLGRRRTGGASFLPGTKKKERQRQKDG